MGDEKPCAEEPGVLLDHLVFPPKRRNNTSVGGSGTELVAESSYEHSAL